MQALHSLFAQWPDTALAFGGFVIGFAFGALLSATNYCVMGAISDWRLSGNMERLGGVAIAAATAIAGAQTLDASGVVDLSYSIYLGTHINWVGAIGGGLLFGFGMVYAGGCPSRALVRLGNGDIRGLIVLAVLAIAAYAAISGVLAGLRVALEATTAINVKPAGALTQSLADIFALAGLSTAPARTFAIAMVLVPLLAFAGHTAEIFSHPRQLLAGIGVGLLSVAGWLLTGLASDDFATNPLKPASLSFIRPVADAIDWVERSTALGLPGFGAATVFGVIAGAFLSSAMSGQIRITAFADAGDLKRHLTGALAMGLGGVLALGCSIGQGVTGISTLSVQSIIACASIIAGAVLGLGRLERSL